MFVVEPKQSFERIRAQEGAFIISAFHERFEREQILSSTKNLPVYEYDTITVPGDKKDDILEELSLLNFTRETLYPSLDEVADRNHSRLSVSLKWPGATATHSGHRQLPMRPNDD